MQFAYNNNMQAFTEISSFQVKYDKDMQINEKMIRLKENNETNFMKLLFLTDETENEKAHTTV